LCCFCFQLWHMIPSTTSITALVTGGKHLMFLLYCWDLEYFHQFFFTISQNIWVNKFSVLRLVTMWWKGIVSRKVFQLETAKFWQSFKSSESKLNLKVPISEPADATRLENPFGWNFQSLKHFWTFRNLRNLGTLLDYLHHFIRHIWNFRNF
jgi:hypothetical protein